MRVVALGGQRGALVDAEAVLLVGDDEPEVLVLHVRREQGMRADDEGELAGLETFVQRAALPGPGRGGEQRAGDAERLQKRSERAIVLLGKDFCRGHEGALKTVFRGHVDGGGGDHRFARADVALHEAVHRALTCQVARDIADGAALCAGEGKGERGEKGRKVDFFALFSRDERAALAQELEAEREQEKLFERKAAARGGEGFVVCGEVDVFVGKAGVAELVGEADVLRKDVRKFVDAGGEALFDGLIEHRLADARGERVDGHDAAGDLVRALALKEGIGHLRAARRTLGTAEEDVGVAGVEGVFEVGLVEIGKFKRAGLVDGAELDKVEPLANAREPGLARDDGADTGILAGDEAGDLLVRAAVVVGAGKVGKEGAQVGDAEFGERLGARFAHALDIADIGVERCHAVDPLYKCGVCLL